MPNSKVDSLDPEFLSPEERLRKRVMVKDLKLAMGGKLPYLIGPGGSRSTFVERNTVIESETLLKNADDALYVAKRTGRNRVVGFGTKEYEEHRS